jgi:hypothetical protein
MGSLIPIGGGADAEIQNLLNAAFNASNIKIIRTKVANEDLLDGNHHLHRIAYRLGTYPIGNYGADDAKGKWFFFLKNILKTADHNGMSTAASIRKILAYALSHATGADKVVRVVFRAIQGIDSNAEHFVSSAPDVATEPGNPHDNTNIARLVDTTGTLSVLLVCPAPLSNKSAPVPNQTSDVDKDTQGSIIEKPPIKIFTPQDLSPPTLSLITRKPKGKGTYKRPPKTSKKAKKMKAKKAKKRR